VEIEYITELIEEGEEHIDRAKEKVLSKFGHSIEDIDSPVDTPNYGAMFTMSDGDKFCLQEISSQCGWLVLCNYVNPTPHSVEIATEIAEFMAHELYYAGVFINVTTDFLMKVAVDYGYTPITTTLYYKELSYD